MGTVMEKLSAAIATLSHSEPTFRVSIEKEYVIIKLKHKYTHVTMPHDDAITALAKQCSSEGYNTLDRTFRNTTTPNVMYTLLITEVFGFFVNKSPLKNPRQSHMYRWLAGLRGLGYNHRTSEGMLALYQYIYDNKLSSVHRGDARVKNVLAILELMKEKYEAK